MGSRFFGSEFHTQGGWVSTQGLTGVKLRHWQDRARLGLGPPPGSPTSQQDEVLGAAGLGSPVPCWLSAPTGHSRFLPHGSSSCKVNSRRSHTGPFPAALTSRSGFIKGSRDQLRPVEDQSLLKVPCASEPDLATGRAPSWSQDALHPGHRPRDAGHGPFWFKPSRGDRVLKWFEIYQGTPMSTDSPVGFLPRCLDSSASQRRALV